LVMHLMQRSHSYRGGKDVHWTQHRLFTYGQLEITSPGAHSRRALAS